MADIATMYAAAAAVVMAIVAVLTIVMKFWPKPLRPRVDQIDNNIEMLTAKNEALEKEVIDLKNALKQEVDRTDKDIERLDAKNEKLTDLMIRILQNGSHR